ncbi:MAG: glycerol-3-phosphate 1-O-acyltransferase PlsY [Chloroflexi bacterium]|nr:glycerol-3-phosphate 1-O-acyltransferase PlsY [Chloroflexota bacterium]
MAVLALCYLVGAIPFGFVAGKVCRGIDIREFGSGSIGATNTLRTLGKLPSALVLLGDIGKGAAAVLLARFLLGPDAMGVEVAAALAAVAGHNWPVYIGFKGGKGVSTSIGALVMIAPWVGLISTAIGLAAMAVFRYVSLGSLLIGAVSFFAALVLYLAARQPVEHVLFTLVAASLMLVRHRDNVARLLSGSERRLGEKADTRAGQA